jgi:hypothetical protein
VLFTGLAAAEASDSYLSGDTSAPIRYQLLMRGIQHAFCWASWKFPDSNLIVAPPAVSVGDSRGPQEFGSDLLLNELLSLRLQGGHGGERIKEVCASLRPASLELLQQLR